LLDTPLTHHHVAVVQEIVQFFEQNSVQKIVQHAGKEGCLQVF